MCFRKILSYFRKRQQKAEHGEFMPDHPTDLVANIENSKTDDDRRRVNETDIIDTVSYKNEESTLINMNKMKEQQKIKNEFDYLERLIEYRLQRYFPGKQEHSFQDPFDPVNDFPSLEKWHLPWQKFADDNNLNQKDENGHYKKQDELTLLLIGLVPHVMPDLFDKAIADKINGSADFANIGGVRGKNSRFFLPTGETALFLLADDDFERRLQVKQLFGAEHLFWQKKIIWLEDMQNGEPAMHGRLIVSPDYVDLLTYGVHQSPQFSISFPAKKIAPVKSEDQQSAPSFDDLVIPGDLKDQIKELESWLNYNDELMNKFGMKDRLKKGYRTLFCGPPGTGKTFTAVILGNHLKKDVFKIDLSMVVSKYIGETEKNLELLFARAEDKEWILFFDEADALFGKRTNVRDAHDKYANQEVSYLLQRIEDYNGLVILATNMLYNIDDAFKRRFNSILKFPFPDPSQRAEIWKKALPKNAVFRKKTVAGTPPEVREEEADIPEAVKKYELTGGNIINIVHYASIKAVEALHEKPVEQIYHYAGVDPCCEPPTVNEEPKLPIYLGDVVDGIKRELIKEGKPFSL